MAARFSGAARFEAEMKIRTFDDQIRDALYVAHFPEAYDEREALSLVCMLDISDRVEAQAKLSRMQAEFAHAARVSMRELTASIAHEVNQPLGAILTSGETAIRWLDRQEPDLGELRALAKRTVSDARRAGDVIRRIRSMASHGEPELVQLALNDVVEEVMLFLGRSFGAKPCKRRSIWLRTSPLCGVTGSNSSRSSQISRSTRCRRWQANENAASSSGLR